MSEEKRANFHRLEVNPNEHGYTVILDEKELYGVEKYKIESLGTGKAKLTLEMVVKHP